MRGGGGGGGGFGGGGFGGGGFGGAQDYAPSPQLMLSDDESLGFTSGEGELSSGDFSFRGSGW
jgi:hypothetical protein